LIYRLIREARGGCCHSPAASVDCPAVAGKRAQELGEFPRREVRDDVLPEEIEIHAWGACIIT
jgi:hypothetical protein